ncbi:MAG: tripartite tricarboxylate transporter TctB family protein [Desulfovibrio sp.]|nr:tripartite tricarboxylate transporter TctB family protein [Desulfovibrio sp.]
MQKSDIGVIGVIYAICLIFSILTLDLPEDAQTYPSCLLATLAGLNTLYLVRCLVRLRRSGLNDDLPQIFSGFLRGQFFTVLFSCIGYMILLHAIGFYLASAAYLAGVMLFLRVRTTHILITAGVLALLIYAVFTLFLKVPLPTGALFG